MGKLMEGTREQREEHGDAAMIVVYLGASEASRRTVVAEAWQRLLAHRGGRERSVVEHNGSGEWCGEQRGGGKLL